MMSRPALWLVLLTTVSGFVFTGLQGLGASEPTTVGPNTNLRTVAAERTAGVAGPVRAASADQLRLPALLAARGNPLWDVPLTALTATRQMPIFSPLRRPRPPAVQALPSIQPAAPAAIEQFRGPPFALVGAIRGEGVGIAILLDASSKGVVRLRTGESHLGWVLQQVERREVTLEKDSVTSVLALPNPPAN